MWLLLVGQSIIQSERNVWEDEGHLNNGAGRSFKGVRERQGTQGKQSGNIGEI